MTKFLNLDEIETPVDKVVVLKGQRHQLRPFSVGEFIDQLKEMESYEQRPEIPVSEFIDHMVGTVQKAFPTIPEADLRALEMHKLKALTDFVRGVTEQEALAGAPEEATGNAEGETVA